MILTYNQYINEVWLNKIGKSSKEKSVVSTDKLASPQSYKKGAEKVDTIGPLEIYSAHTPGGGMTHFTWHPGEKLIHHTVHAAEANKNGGKTRLKFLSAHGREGSPVRMDQVYSKLVQDHNREFVATGHSPGAKKMWDRLRQNSSLKVSDETGREVHKDENVYADHKTVNPEEKKIGRKVIILSKRD